MLPTEDEMRENDRVQWYRVGPGGMCPRCGEERLVTKVEDRNGPRHYCDVCAHEWPPKTYDDAIAAPTACRCGRLVTRPENCPPGPCPFRASDQADGAV